MWQFHYQLALDMAAQRIREADQVRLARELRLGAPALASSRAAAPASGSPSVSAATSPGGGSAATIRGRLATVAAGFALGLDEGAACAALGRCAATGPDVDFG